jgi:hypothetical protein
MRRAAIALAVIASLMLSIPVSAQADQQCGLLVCADATSAAGWNCEIFTMGNFGFASCYGDGSGAAGGHSDLSIPGSAFWDVTVTCTIHAGATTYPCGVGREGPHTCTWAGLGEDACGGSFGQGGFGPFGVPLAPGQCVRQAMDPGQFDVEIEATATSTASKSLLMLGELESMVASEQTSAFLSQVPEDVTTCLPAA